MHTSVIANPSVAMVSSEGMMDPSRALLAVLVVDDEQHMVSELEEALVDVGYAVFTACSAAQARKLLETHPEIGVMISDIRMPDCDGIELTRHALAHRDDTVALEVILVTGHATLDDAAAAMRHGAFDFVRKPFRLKDMFAAASRAMERSLSRRDIANGRANPAAHGEAPPQT